MTPKQKRPKTGPGAKQLGSNQKHAGQDQRDAAQLTEPPPAPASETGAAPEPEPAGNAALDPAPTPASQPETPPDATPPAAEPDKPEATEKNTPEPNTSEANPADVAQPENPSDKSEPAKQIAAGSDADNLAPNKPNEDGPDKDSPDEGKSDEGKPAAGKPAPAQPPSDAGKPTPDTDTPAKNKSGFNPQRVAENFPAPAQPRRILRKALYILLACLILLAGAAGYAAIKASHFLNTPAVETEKLVEVEILRGDTFGKVAKRLNDAGIITNALYFRLYAMWEGRTGSIQAGVFEFATNWTPREVLQHLVFGHPVLYRLTLREGLPWWEVAKLAEENGFATAEDFKTVIHDPDFLTKHGIPFANAEGFLFPDTYFLRKPKVMDEAAALALANRLVDTFRKKTAELFAGQDMDKEKLKMIVTLASMVEKETGVADERPTVAGVFANRLALGMPMQCDPTIIYGLGENFDGNIRKSDLENDANPYNTYRHPGLPPGPICSPGLESLTAAMHPGKHDYLYFVATKAGGAHVFNANLKDHINAVNKYQRGRGN